jgi:hypothetical protein
MRNASLNTAIFREGGIYLTLPPQSWALFFVGLLLEVPIRHAKKSTAPGGTREVYKPSRTSGRARKTITDIEIIYVRALHFILNTDLLNLNPAFSLNYLSKVLNLTKRQNIANTSFDPPPPYRSPSSLSSTRRLRLSKIHTDNWLY